MVFDLNTLFFLSILGASWQHRSGQMMKPWWTQGRLKIKFLYRSISQMSENMDKAALLEFCFGQ